ncbi:amidohydrolase [Bacteroides sp. 519]|uniref:amidohydrolase n=1 Tax=Bacteroides sp. 519 TaxID=2302937 RepID=UPI0013CF4B04|nr:amidohydrolase [Bacteroides sp. 519]NDV58108.1 amidohydrolase [Bacteroides sp. 519]
MKVSLFQTNIIWENIEENLNRLQKKLESLQEGTNLVILPEMFSTGFSMNSEQLAEPVTGNTIRTLKELASHYQTAITGSFIATENNKYYNRGFFITPNKDACYYDKHHLFRMGDEINHFAAGNQKLIVNYQGWNICLLICYDLRFPVWSRNVNNEYDLLVYTANWPSSRQSVWDTLLPARALENMCYVCGVNRVGTDGNDLNYQGGSVLYSPKGKLLGKVQDNEEAIETIEIDLQSLQTFREKFPVWKDADSWIILDTDCTDDTDFKTRI